MTGNAATPDGGRDQQQPLEPRPDSEVVESRSIGGDLAAFSRDIRKATSLDQIGSKVAEVVFRAIDSGTKVDLPAVLAAELKDRGYIDVISPSTYREQKDDIARQPSVTSAKGKSEAELASLQEQIEKLDGKLNSRWHRFWSSSDRLDEERRQLSRQQDAAEELTASISQASVEIDRLEQLEQELGRFVETSEGYIRLTPSGQDTFANLRVRTERLEGVSFSEFASELEQVTDAIQLRFDRFQEMYDYLVEQGFEKGDTKVIDYALSLSLQEGEIADVYERASVINSYLYEKEWKSYDRLRIVAQVSSKAGEIEDLQEELRQIFVCMVDDYGHQKGYSTWSEAAAIIDISGNTPQEKVGRFESMRTALAEKGWKKGSAACCYISAKVAARQDGEIQELADRHRAIELALVERGQTDSVESGIAALILMNAQGEPDAIADRFNQSFETLHAYGCEKHTKYYAIAAAVSLLPGTVEENVKLIDDEYAKLKDNGYNSNLVARALSIVSGGYGNVFKQDSVPSFVTTSSNFNPNTFSSDDGGFSMSGALIGDIIDNGSLDLSSGFLLGGMMGGVTGGLVGGLFDD